MGSWLVAIAIEMAAEIDSFDADALEDVRVPMEICDGYAFPVVSDNGLFMGYYAIPERDAQGRIVSARYVEFPPVSECVEDEEKRGENETSPDKYALTS